MTRWCLLVVLYTGHHSCICFQPPSLATPQTWGIDPADMLMVGDSFEDVECGNAAGTATCLVAGGAGWLGPWACRERIDMGCVPGRMGVCGGRVFDRRQPTTNSKGSSTLLCA